MTETLLTPGDARCPECWYPLPDLPVSADHTIRCPECGTLSTLDTIAPVRTPAWKTRRCGITPSILTTAVGTTGIAMYVFGKHETRQAAEAILMSAFPAIVMIVPASLLIGVAVRMGQVDPKYRMKTAEAALTAWCVWCGIGVTIYVIGLSYIVGILGMP